MGQQVRQLFGKQVAGIGYHLGLGLLTFGDVVHLLFKLGGHIGVRDVRGELVQRIAHRHTQLAGFDGVVLHVLHGVQTLDDGMAGRFGSQPQLLHLLDQATLRIAGRGLGLVLRTGGAAEGNLLTFFKSRQLLVLLQAIRIDGAEARLHQHIALGNEFLAAHFERYLGALHHGRIGKRGQEAAGDEVVQLELRRGQLFRRGACRGIDRRMVGGFLLAARGVQWSRGKQLLAVRHVGRVAHQVLHGFGQVQRRGIHGVVDARVADEAVHVQALGQAHGACRS